MRLRDAAKAFLALMHSEMNSSIALRPYRLGDELELFAAVDESRAQLAPWLPWCHPAYCLEDSRAWIAERPALFEQGKEYCFAIVDAQGRMLGGCGLNRIEEGNGVANLGYWVRRSAQGRGHAAAATRLLAAWAFANTPLRRLEIVASVENHASLRTAERAGARRDAVLRSRIVLDGRRHDAVLFSILGSS